MGEEFEHELEARGLVEPDPEDPAGSDPEGDGLYDRYIFALVLLVASIIAFSFTADYGWGRLASVVLEGCSLLVILKSSRVHNRLQLAANVFVAAAIVASLVAIAVGDDTSRTGSGIIGVTLAVLGPPVVVRRMLAHHRIDITTVAAALCVYLLAGILFAYVFWIIGDIDPSFFAQEPNPEAVDYMYFSFVTLATLGYGDLTARSDLGRMLSATEAILGQLYLVSAVALLVANIGRSRTPTAMPRPRIRRRSNETSGDDPRP